MEIQQVAAQDRLRPRMSEEEQKAALHVVSQPAGRLREQSCNNLPPD